MARPKDPEKRTAILDAAVGEIAEAGLGAPTAKIAKRAGIAEGTLFTYFSNKDELLNELYVTLKSEFYTLVNTGFPHTASLERRAHHIWTAYVNWALEHPARRRVSQQLHISSLLSAEARERASVDRGPLHDTLAAIDARASLQHLPRGTASATMASMHEATIDLVNNNPKQRRAKLIEGMFQLYWRAVR